MFTFTFSTLVKLVPAFRNNDLPISVTTLYFPLKSTGTWELINFKNFVFKT